MRKRNSKRDEERALMRHLARPFDPAILAKAKDIVADYAIVLWFEDGEWHGHGLEYPTAYGDGKTAGACVASVRKGLEAVIAYMLENGETPPLPAKKEDRTGTESSGGEQE